MVVTSPSVPYKIKLKNPEPGEVDEEDGLKLISSPAHWIERDRAETYFEPRVRGTIIAPNEYMSDIVSLCTEARGEQVDTSIIDENRYLGALLQS